MKWVGIFVVVILFAAFKLWFNQNFDKDIVSDRSYWFGVAFMCSVGVVQELFRENQ